MLPLLAAVALADPITASDLDGPGLADTGGAFAPERDRSDGEGVVGGSQVRRGRWDDAVGVVHYSAYVGCTGTLIGPRVVLTAGHCVDGIQVNEVLVGSKDWLDPSQGTYIDVDEVIEYPDSWNSYDVALLLLAEAAEPEPRALALECVVKDYLRDGAEAQMVGFGATTPGGDDFNHELNEAPTVILDRNCSEPAIDGVATGCRAGINPGGEVAGGGDGTHVCYGDSGGPLYLKTDEGRFLAGVASRLFAGSPLGAPCSEGSIWVRPDAVIDWIEDNVGNRAITYPSCNVPATLDTPELETSRGALLVHALGVTDPDGDASQATFALAADPEHGEAHVLPNGLLLYTPEAGFVGEDVVTVAVTDGPAPEWERTGGPVTVEHEVPIRVVQAERGLGCQTAPGAPWALGLLLLAPLARIRR